MFEWLLPYVDYLFLIGAGALDVSFLPTVFRPANKPDRLTSVVFTVVLSVFTLGFIAMSMPLSSIAQGIGVMMWGITIFQKRVGERRAESFVKEPEEIDLMYSQQAPDHLSLTGDAALDMIRNLQPEEALEIARKHGGSSFHGLMMYMIGQDTNPRWITAEAINISYERDLITVQEFQELVKRHSI